MAEITYDPTDVDAGEFSADELDSLQVGELLAQAEDRMLAGKYENAEQLEQAYLNLQQKMGEESGQEEEEYYEGDGEDEEVQEDEGDEEGEEDEGDEVCEEEYEEDEEDEEDEEEYDEYEEDGECAEDDDGDEEEDEEYAEEEEEYEEVAWYESE